MPREKTVKHHGRFRHRLESNALESIFAARWETENARGNGRRNGVLELSMHSNGDGHVKEPCTQEEATVAATVVQWLGSPVGFSWLRDTLKDAGFVITPSDRK